MGTKKTFYEKVVKKHVWKNSKDVKVKDIHCEKKRKLKSEKIKPKAWSLLWIEIFLLIILLNIFIVFNMFLKNFKDF